MNVFDDIDVYNESIKSWTQKKSYWRLWLSTVDLLVLTSLDQLFLLKIVFNFFTKQAAWMRWSTALSLPPPLVFCGVMIIHLLVRTGVRSNGGKTDRGVKGYLIPY